MLTRLITDRLKKSIARVPTVILLGARQVGKTTLAKQISWEYAEPLGSGDFEMQFGAPEAMFGARRVLYLDLQAPEDLLKLSDPTGFFRSHSNQLVVLDEIQRKPEFFPILRGIIDKNRQHGQKASQFLLLGSASMHLLRQSSESLAGRISHIEMSGFHVLEIEPSYTAIQKLWLRGGFPNSYLADNDEIAMDWLEDLIRTYLERDVPQMGFQIPAARLRRLWTMLAHWQGELVNCSTLGSNLEIDSKTVGHYIDILRDLLLLRRLEPWHANVKKRLIKSPRYYTRDSGIQHRLLSINNYDALLSHPVMGKSWEGFVVENIHAVLPHRAETYFYRTAAGAEIDLLIKMPCGAVWAAEIKYGTAPKLKPRHYSAICDDVGATHKYVIYGGDDEFPIGDEVTMISLPKFMQKLFKWVCV